MIKTFYGFYEIKKGKKKELVRASGMAALDLFCKENGYSDWQMIGMVARGTEDSYRIVA